jgi:transposase
MGRPCKLTPELQERICDLLESGNTRRDVAYIVGISCHTFQRWMRQGRTDPESEFRIFRLAVRQKEAAAVARNVQIIRDAASDQWQAAARWLERRYPERWGSHSREIKELARQLKELEKRLGHEERGW